MEACLHENIEQLTTSVIVALSVRVARQGGQAELKAVCIAVSCAAARVHGSACARTQEDVGLYSTVGART